MSRLRPKAIANRIESIVAKSRTTKQMKAGLAKLCREIRGEAEPLSQRVIDAALKRGEKRADELQAHLRGWI